MAVTSIPEALFPGFAITIERLDLNLCGTGDDPQRLALQDSLPKLSLAEHTLVVGVDIVRALAAGYLIFWS